MFTERELKEAINECEKQPASYSTCEKLATFYTVLDHLYPENKAVVMREERAGDIVDIKGKSEFIEAINGKKASEIWKIMDELMDCLQITDPHLYSNVLRKINE